MSNPRKYFLRQYSNENYWHGGIGYTHMETILAEEGYIPVELPTASVPVFSSLLRLVKLLSIFARAKRQDEWVFVYPVYGRMNRWLLNLLIKKEVKITGIVGDIDGLKDNDEKKLKKDIAFLHRLPALIVHNSAMDNWFRSNGYRGKTSSLQLFDFLAKPVTGEREISNTVVFAGNLEKSPFLYQLDQPSLRNIDFNVYGKGKEEAKEWPRNVHYKGAYKPTELPGILEGSFGLLWDGNQWDEPGGAIGNYMPYISHHKLSLYVLAGLPILVPRIAGSSRFIEENGLGIVIGNLADIETEIKKLSAESYRGICKNLSKCAERISQGKHLLESMIDVR